jgi:hypothetical protein
MRRPPRPAWVLVLLLTGPIAQAQTLTNNSALSFGSFTAGSGGSVTVAPGGGRSKTGAVVLVNQGVPAAAAQFTISGTPSALFDITLPANGTVLLSDGVAASMALNNFTSIPSGSGMLSGGGTQTITVGATLTVGGAQTPGSYSGSFNVTVNYQ